MSELQTFFHMGGYAYYVWPAFLISLLVLVANVWISNTQYKRVLRETAIRVAALERNRQEKKQSQ